MRWSRTRSPVGRLRADEPEERPVERVDPGRDDPDRAEAEGEDRVLAVAGVVMRRPVAARTARLAWPPKRSWSAPSRCATGSPACQASSSQRAPTSVSARPWIRPCGPDSARPHRPVVAQVAVVAEREPAGRVRRTAACPPAERRQLRRPAQVDERGRRLDRADALPARVVAEGPDVAVRARAGRRRRARPRPSRTRRCRTARAAR